MKDVLQNYIILMQIEPSIFLDKWVQAFELILSDKKNLGQKNYL